MFETFFGVFLGNFWPKSIASRDGCVRNALISLISVESSWLPTPWTSWELSGTGDSQRDSRESFAIDTPIFIAPQSDSPESLEFRFAQITPLSSGKKGRKEIPKSKEKRIREVWVWPQLLSLPLFPPTPSLFLRSSIRRRPRLVWRRGLRAQGGETRACAMTTKFLDNKIFTFRILLSWLAGVLRGNTIRGNTTRNSERKMALWEGLWEGLWKTSENL